MSLRVTIVCDGCERAQEVSATEIAANVLPSGWRKYEVGQLFREPWRVERLCEECADKEAKPSGGFSPHLDPSRWHRKQCQVCGYDWDTEFPDDPCPSEECTEEREAKP